MFQLPTLDMHGTKLMNWCDRMEKLPGLNRHERDEIERQRSRALKQMDEQRSVTVRRHKAWMEKTF